MQRTDVGAKAVESQRTLNEENEGGEQRRERVSGAYESESGGEDPDTASVLLYNTGALDELKAPRLENGDEMRLTNLRRLISKCFDWPIANSVIDVSCQPANHRPPEKPKNSRPRRRGGKKHGKQHF